MANSSRVTVKVFDRDRGAKTVLARLAKAVRPTVKVGIFGEKADALHVGSKLSNVEIASVHEFGSETVPERSFIRGAVDENIERIRNIQRRSAALFLNGKITIEAALGIIGESVTSMIKARIAAGIDPPDSPETIRRKGSSTPLVDTVQLKGSIQWEVAKS